ncbi:MAG: hypothetical protein NC830_00205 [Candidatus Omnitrophica bacterium]|nr:hypothetical protein [Candidatus Omnitrophota bacterium]
MVNGFRVITKLTVAGLFLLFAGCGGKGEKVELPDVKFVMKLPSGWVNDRATRGNSDYKQFYEAGKYGVVWGDISVGPLESHDIFTGKTKKVNTLVEYVNDIFKDQEKLSAMFAGMGKALGKTVGGEAGERIKEEVKEGTSLPIISKTQRTINGFEAIEVVLNTPVSAFNVYIRKDDKVIAVSFMAPREEFSGHEVSFRNSIESIKIR